MTAGSYQIIAAPLRAARSAHCSKVRCWVLSFTFERLGVSGKVSCLRYEDNDDDDQSVCARAALSSERSDAWSELALVRKADAI